MSELGNPSCSCLGTYKNHLELAPFLVNLKKKKITYNFSNDAVIMWLILWSASTRVILKMQQNFDTIFFHYFFVKNKFYRHDTRKGLKGFPNSCILTIHF